MSGLNKGKDTSAIFGDNVRAENERVKEAQVRKGKNIDYSQITQLMDTKITKLEQMNSRVLKMHEANQKGKQRLQEAPDDGMSIVNRMTGDPRKKVYEQREGERSKSRRDVERTTRN